MKIPLPEISKENKTLIIKFFGTWLILVSVGLIAGAVYTGHFELLLNSLFEIGKKA